MDTIGERIRTKRKELGLTQAELGEKLGVTDRAVSKWEQDEGNPDISIVANLATILQVSIDYLLTGIVTAEKIIIKSPKEILFETDDIKYLDRISVNDLSIVEIYEHKLANTFAYLLDNHRIRAHMYGKRRLSSSNYNDFILEIEYFLLISNREDRCGEFYFKEIGYADNNEITEEWLDAFATDDRISDDTKTFILSIHKRRIVNGSFGSGEHGNWTWLYPRIFKKLVEKGNWKWVDYMLDLIKDLAPLSIDYAQLNQLLESNQYELLNKANSINASKGKDTLSERKIDIHKMNISNAPLKEKLIYTYVDVILDFAKLQNHPYGNEELLKKDKATWLDNLLKDRKALYHEIVVEYPMFHLEIVARALKNNDYKKVSQLAVDMGLNSLVDKIIEGDKQAIFNEASRLLKARSNRIQDVPDDINKAVVFFDQIKEEVFSDWVNNIQEMIDNRRDEEQRQKNIAQIKTEIPKEYLLQEIEKGNIENAIIKLCVKLESILKNRYRLTGDLFTMLDSFFDMKHCKEEWKEVLSKLRMKRNSLVHSEITPVSFSKQDLLVCIDIVESI